MNRLSFNISDRSRFSEHCNVALALLVCEYHIISTKRPSLDNVDNMLTPHEYLLFNLWIVRSNEENIPPT
jgi:hypothetical protein